MAVRFSSEEIRRITRAIRTLTDPLSYDCVDSWRLTVNRQVRELVGASSAGFLLPGRSMPMLSEEHDQQALAGFPALLPPTLTDGTPIWTRLIELEVATLEMAYGPESIRQYYDSAYYNEYAAANGACETIAASFAVGDSHGGGWASLHFWNNRIPQPPRFRERDVEILRLLFPAFRAGVETHLRYGAVRSRLHSLIDRLEVAAMICDAGGRVLHQTPALTLLLEGDPEGSSLRAQLEQLAFSPSECCRTVATASARYRVSAAWQAAPRDAATVLRLITIERLTARPRSDEDLRNEFSLTRAECRVSRLLAAGMSNADLAAELSISPYTARRHTEQVLKKLAVRSRAEVAAKLAR